MSNTRAPSRRDFIKGSTAAAAGLALAGGLNFSRSAHAAGDDLLKVGLIGCGGRGAGAAVNCLDSVPNVKLVALGDVFADRANSTADALRKQHPDKVDLPQERVFVGFDSYQKVIEAGVDVVLIATPPGFRPIHYEAAIKAGKHVFMEKPCCIDAPGFRSLMETNKLADEKNLKVVVGLQRRYQASYVAGIKKIHDGAIGDLILCQAYWNGGEPWFRERQPGQGEMDYQMRNWYHFVWLCGDNICEQHVHNIDVCNWAKNDYPIEANGMGACVQRYAHRDPKKGYGQIYDQHFVEFTYKDGSKMYSQCRQIPNTWNSVSETVFGTKGKSNCQSNGKSLKFLPNPYDQEHVALFDAIRKNEKHNDGWHGAKSSFTAVLGRMATYSGAVVKWDEAAAKGPNEMPQKYAFDANPPAMPDKDGKYFMPIPGAYKPY